MISLSCSSKKNIIYLQSENETSSYLTSYSEYKLKTDDILKITLKNDISIVGNFSDRVDNVTASNMDSMTFEGYQIDYDGYINIENLGKIKATGLTINQFREKLIKKIVEDGVLLRPNLDVKLLNGSFSIIGEVNMPGNYKFLENNLNVLECIAMAGDLTITGSRSEIKLIRSIDGKTEVINLDITDANILQNKNFQIYSGDIIVVNPNSTRVKNAGIIGNSGTLLSLLSFILSSIIVINN